MVQNIFSFGWTFVLRLRFLFTVVSQWPKMVEMLACTVFGLKCLFVAAKFRLDTYCQKFISQVLESDTDVIGLNEHPTSPNVWNKSRKMQGKEINVWGWWDILTRRCHSSLEQVLNSSARVLLKPLTLVMDHTLIFHLICFLSQAVKVIFMCCRCAKEPRSMLASCTGCFWNYQLCTALSDSMDHW